MIPLVGFEEELRLLREETLDVAEIVPASAASASSTSWAR